MANLRTSLLAITALWNKSRLLLASLAILACADGLYAQASLSPKKQKSFDETFFEAQTLKAKGDMKEARELFEELYEMDENNATVHYELAKIYTEDKDESQAVYHAKKAARLDSQNIWYQRLLAEVYTKFGYHSKLVEVYQKLVKHDPDNPEPRYELAKAYLMANQPENALHQLDSLELQLGVNEVITEQKKSIYLEMGDLEGAAREIRNLINEFPSTLEYYGSLGQLYSANGLEEKAFEVYQQMLEIDSLDPRPHLDLANYHRKNGNFAQSLHHLKIALRSEEMELEKKIPVLLSLFQASAADSVLRQEAYQIMDYLQETNPDDPRIYAMYGDYLSRDGNDLQAIKYYKKALAREGGQKFQIWEQVLLIEIQNDMYDSLAVDAPRAVESFPNQPLPYFFAGAAFNMKKNYEEALYYLEDGLNYVIGNPALKEQFYTQLADVHHRLENHDHSDAYFEKALNLNSRNATSLNNYAYYLSVRGENLDRALELTEKSNRLSPDNPVFLDTWAWVLYKKGQYQEALEKMQRVFELEPQQSGEVLEHYGDILSRLERNEEALEKYRQALEAGGASSALSQKIKSLQ